MSESAHRNNEVALVFKDKHTLKCFSGYSMYLPTGLAFYLTCLCVSINLAATLANYSVTLIRMADSSLGNMDHSTCQEFILLFAK